MYFAYLLNWVNCKLVLVKHVSDVWSIYWVPCSMASIDCHNMYYVLLYGFAVALSSIPSITNYYNISIYNECKIHWNSFLNCVYVNPKKEYCNTHSINRKDNNNLFAQYFECHFNDMLATHKSYENALCRIYNFSVFKFNAKSAASIFTEISKLDFIYLFSFLRWRQEK